MPDIDNLSVKIKAKSDTANRALSDLISNLNKMTSALQSVGRVQGFSKIDDLAKRTSRTFESISKQFEGLGKGFQIKGDFSQITRGLNTLENNLSKAIVKEEELRLGGKTDTAGYENAVKDIVKYRNMIDSVKASLSEIEKPIDKGNYKIHTMSGEFEVINGEIHEITQSATEMGQVIQNAVSRPFKNDLAGIGTPLPNLNDIEKTNTKSLADLRQKLSQLVIPPIDETNLNKLEASLKKTEEEIDKLRAKLENGITMGRITENEGDKGFVRIQEEIALAEKRAEALKARIAEIKAPPSVELKGIETALKSATNIGIKGFQTLGKVGVAALRSIGNFAGKIGSKFASMLNPFKKLTSASKGMNVSLAGGFKTVLKYAFGIRSLFVLFNKLRNAVKEGMKNLVQYSDETNASVSMLKNSLTQLKNSVAAAVSPLLNALAPALDAIIQLCVKATNAINQLISSLLGNGTWIRAKKLTDSYRDSINGASKAAKNGIRAFDELNVINTQNDGGSGAGTAAADMFETLPIESKFSDLAERIKEMWAKADFTELGAMIGSKLKDSLDEINWEPIKARAEKIGKSIATLINGFVEVDGLGYTIGENLAEAFNTGLAFINSFLDNTHWDSVGKFIGDGLNGIVDTIDWEGIGHMFAQKLNAIFGVLGNLAATFKWEEFGNSLADSINTFFRDFDFGEMAETLNTWVDGIWTAIKTTLSKINWETIWDDIREFFSKLDLKTGIVLSIFMAPAEIKEIEKVIKLFTKLGGVIKTIGTLFSGISAPVGIAVATIGTLAAGLGYVFATNEDVRNSFSEAIGTIKDSLAPALEFLTTTVLPDIQNGFARLLEILTPIKDFLVEMFTSIWQDMINPALKNIGENVLPKLTEVFENLWQNVLVPLGSLIADVLAPVIEFLADVLKVLWKNAVVPLAQSIGGVLLDAFNVIADTINWVISDIISPLIKAISWIWTNALAPIVNQLLNNVKPVFETVFTFIGNLVKNLKDIFSGLINFISGLFTGNWSSAWEGVKNIFKGIWNSMATIAEGAINIIIDGINWMTSGIRDAISGVAGLVGIDINIGEIPHVNIPQYASGGYIENPHSYSLFAAGENGIPEILGTVGGKSAVAGGDEITGISDTIRSETERQNELLRQEVQLLQELLRKNFGITKDEIGRAARDYSQEYFDKNGKPAFAY